MTVSGDPTSQAESGLVLLIYQTVEAPEQLDAVLAALADLTGAESARLVHTDGAAQTVLATGRAKAWSGRPRAVPPEGSKSEIGVRILPLFGAYELVLDRSDPSPDRLEHLVRVAPHLARALSLAERLEVQRQGLLLRREKLEQLPFGVVLLDRDKRVLLLNGAAGAMTRPNEPLDLREQRLVPRAAVARVMFDMLLDQSVRPGRPGPRRHRGGQISLPVRGRVGAELVVAPFRAPTERGECACVVLVFSPKLALADPESLFVARFGLSVGEARAAARVLAGRHLHEEGRSDLEMAEERGQLEAVLERLGTTRQSDLVRLLLCGDEPPEAELETSSI